VAKIIDLEFQLEIVGSCNAVDDFHMEKLVSELRARTAYIAELRRHLKLLSFDVGKSEEIRSIHYRRARSISNLPYELLSAIFKKAPIDPADRADFTRTVTQVSRYWRETALQTSFLWSGLYLPIWNTSGGYQILLKIFIQRSQSHPLDIVIDVEGGVEDFSGIRNELNILLPEISRWRTFTFRGDDIDNIIEPLGNLCAPILESLDLCAMYCELGFTGVIGDNDPLVLFGGGVPMLSHVRIGAIIELTPPLSSVTSLYLKEASVCMDGPTFLDMLRSSPVLASLNLVGTIVDKESLYQLALRGDKVEIATLRYLSFTADASPKYYIDSLLNIIRCPGLQSMTISAHNRGMPPSIISALPLPQYPALNSMELCGINCTQFSDHFNFTQLPALETISLIRCTTPMALLRILAPSESIADNDIFWPRLRDMNLSHLGAEEFDGLCEIISHRLTCNRPITTVHIDPRSLEKFPKKVQWMKQYLVVLRGERQNYHEPLTNFPFLLPNDST
jgi:hypothetical protein